MSKFTAENYLKGFLLDDELMAGISETNDEPGVFTAYVVRHTTGETIGLQKFTNLFEAIRTLNDIPREWVFASTTKCGGNCASGKCGKKGGACGTQKSVDQTLADNTCGSKC